MTWTLSWARDESNARLYQGDAKKIEAEWYGFPPPLDFGGIAEFVVQRAVVAEGATPLRSEMWQEPAGSLFGFDIVYRYRFVVYAHESPVVWAVVLAAIGQLLVPAAIAAVILLIGTRITDVKWLGEVAEATAPLALPLIIAAVGLGIFVLSAGRDRGSARARGGPVIIVGGSPPPYYR